MVLLTIKSPIKVTVIVVTASPGEDTIKQNTYTVSQTARNEWESESAGPIVRFQGITPHPHPRDDAPAWTHRQTLSSRPMRQDRGWAFR